MNTGKQITLRPNFFQVYAGVKWSVAVLAAWSAGWPAAIKILALLMGLDFITGVLKAAFVGEVSSAIGKRGLFKKLGTVLAILFVHILDSWIPDTLGMPNGHLGIEKVFALYLAFAEVISIVENLADCGVSFPDPLIKMLAKVKTQIPRTATQGEIDSLSSTVTTTESSTKKSEVKTVVQSKSENSE